MESTNTWDDMNCTTVDETPGDRVAQLNSKNVAGVLRACTFVKIKDIFGNTAMRRISLGTAYSMSLETARGIVDKARESNPDTPIHADYRITL